MFQIISSTELAALQDGVGIEGSLGVLYQLRDTGSYYVWNPTTRTMDGFSAAAVESLVSQAWNSLYTSRPFIKRAPQSLKKMPFGKVISTATSGADHTTSVATVLETAAERIRIGIVNCVAVDVVNVKVGVAAMNAQYANNAAMTGSPAGSGTITTATFTALAGTDADRPKISWSPWMSAQTQDRSDGGTLPAYLVRVQIPGASNANRPAWDNAGVTRAPMEDPANVGERVWKMRGDAALGVDTPAGCVSTAYYDLGVPIVIEYVPRGGVVPLTLTVVGDSIEEGYDTGNVQGYSYINIARDALSTQSRPIEICNLAMSARDHAFFTTRMTAVWADLLPELVLLKYHSPNGITAPTFTWASTARNRYREIEQQIALCAQYDTAVIGINGIPLLNAADEAAGLSKTLDASGATDFARYIATITGTPAPIIDTFGAMSNGSNALGQVRLVSGSTFDSQHPNHLVGKRLMAETVKTYLRGLFLAV